MRITYTWVAQKAQVVSSVRFSLKDLEKKYTKTEDDIKAVQSVGQIIGEVMKKLDDERCSYTFHSTILLVLNYVS